jgi:hypothetical protein
MLFFPEGKKGNTENLPKSNSLSEIEEPWIEKYLFFKGSCTRLLLNASQQQHCSKNLVAKDSVFAVTVRT